MIYLLIIVILLAIFFFTRLFALKKEIKNMGRQLGIYNHQKTSKKIDMSLFDQNIENLGAEINYLIDLHIKAKQEKIRYEKELKQAIANMSHDLRTPLTSIIGYIQMAESNELAEIERKEYISIAIKRAKRLENLLNDFFELSVIESTDYELKNERFNMKNVTIDVLMSFYNRFNEKNMEPIIDLGEDDIFLTTDKSAVIRVIENLISNAIKHSNGSVYVSLKKNNSSVSLIVQNEAQNLTQKDVELLFDRFYMADQSRSGNDSTGMGLSIVKSFMLKMNGNVTSSLLDGQLSIVCEWETTQ